MVQGGDDKGGTGIRGDGFCGCCGEQKCVSQSVLCVILCKRHIRSGEETSGRVPERTRTTRPRARRAKPRERAKYVSRAVGFRIPLAKHHTHANSSIRRQRQNHVHVATSSGLLSSDPMNEGQIIKGTACVPSQARLPKL